MPTTKIPHIETLPVAAASSETHPPSLSHLLNPAPTLGYDPIIETMPVAMDVDSDPVALEHEPNSQKKAQTEGSGEKNLKRTAPTDSEVNSGPRKGPKPDRDIKDLHEAVSFRRGGLPIAKSTLWSRIQNRRFSAGDFVQSSERNIKFRNKILELDPNSIILDPKTVRHFKCGKELKMKEPYNIGNFKVHIENCKGTPKSHKPPAGGMKKIDTFFAKAGPPGLVRSKLEGNVTKPSDNLNLPCPGLREVSFFQVRNYLEHTGAHGGGSPSVSSLAADLFGKKYRKLSRSRKQQVKMAQHHEWLWRNDHTEGAVYSTKCTKKAGSEAHNNTGSGPSSSTSHSNSHLLPCRNCNDLLKLKTFKNIVRKPRPADENYKHINIEYRNETLASLFGRCKGLREIIEVSIVVYYSDRKLIISDRINLRLIVL
jgi:hypothetical protein